MPWLLSKFHLGRVAYSLIREHFDKPKRSAHWAVVRRVHLRKHPRCAACGSKRFRQVHHIVPFTDRPLLELDPTNLITLCMGKHECHLHLGHGGDYHYFNPAVSKNCRVILRHPEKRRDIEINARIFRRNTP